MKRTFVIGAVIAGSALLAVSAWTVTQGQSPRAVHFPRRPLPAASALAPAPGVPIPGLDITPTRVAALYLNGDTRPDLLVMTDTGEVRGLLNVQGTKPAAQPFVPAPLSLSLDGRPLDLLATDLDGDGALDLAFLSRPGPDFSTTTLRGTVVSVTPPTVRVRETFLPRELIGQFFTPDVTRPELTVPITDNAASSIQLSSTGLQALARMRPGSTYQLTRLNMSGGAPRVEIRFGGGGGAFTSSSCELPPLKTDDGREPVSLAAADVDSDGKVDLIIRRAKVLEGRAGDIRPVDALVPIPGVGSESGLRARTYVLTDPAAGFPDFAEGATIVADTREGVEYPIIDNDGTTITFRVPRGTVAQPGSEYRITLAADSTTVLRSLGGRCYSSDVVTPRPVYAVRMSGGTGAQATIIVDPDGHFPPKDALVGQKVRLGALPLAASARTVSIVGNSATELTLDPAAGDLTDLVRGVADGASPSFYAILPPALSVPDPRTFVQSEISSLTYPSDRSAYAPPGRDGGISAAVADVDGDGKDDVILASSQLFLLRHK